MTALLVTALLMRALLVTALPAGAAGHGRGAQLPVRFSSSMRARRVADCVERWMR